MRLKQSLDKYIKGKVQDYRPAYDESMWGRIEEKLPVSRVPGGRGSWMLPIAAVLVIAILTPLTIKFYNLTGRGLAGKSTAQNVKANQVPGIDQASQNADIISMPKTHLAFDQLVKKEPRRKNREFADASNSGKTGMVTRHLDGNILNQNENQGSLAKQVQTDNETVVSENATVPQLLENIYPGSLAHSSEWSDEIKGDGDGRYPNHNHNHPINDQRWENWQSIFYPFWNNPAYTGSEGVVNITGEYHYATNAGGTNTNLGAEYYNRASGIGIGLYRLSDIASASLLQNTYGISMSYPVLRMGSTTLKVGVSGDLMRNTLVSNNINYPDQINPVFGFIYPTDEKNIGSVTNIYGLNGGLWLSNPHVMAGLDVANINQPKQSFTGSDATSVPREWRGTFGYRFAVSPQLQFMPMAIVTRVDKINQANAMLSGVYKDNFMLALAYENIDPGSGLGNIYGYAAVSMAKRIRLFGSYGRNMKLAQTGVNENFVHVGIKYLAFK